MSDDKKIKQKIKPYVIAAGRSVICIQGVKGPGEDIKPEDLKTPENFFKLVKKDRICLKKDYKDNNDSQFRKTDIIEEKEDDKNKTNEIGAQKK